MLSPLAQPCARTVRRAVPALGRGRVSRLRRTSTESVGLRLSVAEVESQLSLQLQLESQLSLQNVKLFLAKCVLNLREAHG